MRKRVSSVYWVLSSLVIIFLLKSCSASKKVIFHNGAFILPSTAEIHKHNFKVGDTIQTSSFYKDFGLGGARYIVEEDNIYNGKASQETKNGLYANLLYRDKVDISQLGALPSDPSFTRQNIDAINEALEVARTVQITKGTYYFMKPIRVPSNSKLEGTGDVRFVGTLLVNGDNNISIVGLTFEHWASVRTYGIWIKPKAVSGLRIDNCIFGDKVHIFSDMPVGRLSDDISITNCRFKWDIGLNPSGVVSVQLHTHNLMISHCTFDTKGLDGCVKVTFGRGEVSVDSCYFKGNLDEEILDSYTFKGDVSFTNNVIELNKGGVVRTKPGRLDNLTKEPYNVFIKGNSIKHFGTDQNLVYIAGSYGLADHKHNGHDIVIEDNIFNCNVVNTPINIRGVNRLSIKNNTIRGRQEKSGSYSIFLSSIQNLSVDYNSIEKSGIIGYIGTTPAGDTYRRNPSTARWSFTNNVFEKYSSKKAPINIDKADNIELVFKNNIFKNFGPRSILFSIINGEYGPLDIDENSIITKTGERRLAGKSNISTQSSKIKSIRLNKRVIRN